MHVSLVGQLALFAFLPICIVLFMKLRLDQATAISLVGACLFLPERLGFDPPLIPPLHKHSISTLVTFIAISTIPKPPQEGSTFFKLASSLILIAAVGTVLTNRDPLVLAPGIIGHGLGFGDILTTTWGELVNLIVPFAIGKRVFNTKESVLTLLKVVASFGVIYGFLMLIEIRVSPQLNLWVYGYYQHDFLQTMRNGGFRPMVFMSHGLITTMYCLMSIFAAIGLEKSGHKVFGAKAGYWAIFLICVLLLSNSMGAAIFCVIGASLLWLARPGMIAKACTVLALAAITVPFLRTSGSVPVQDIIDFFASVNPERANSLAFRIDMEEALIEKWNQRPWFGYAGYGRANIYDDYGKNTIVMDSQWIIAFCYRGVVGYLGEFLLYVVPVLAIRKSLTRILDPDLRPLLLSLTMMVTITTFDLLLNSSNNCLLPLFAGSLFGLGSTLKRSEPSDAEGAHAPPQ